VYIHGSTGSRTLAPDLPDGVGVPDGVANYRRSR